MIPQKSVGSQQHQARSSSVVIPNSRSSPQSSCGGEGVCGAAALGSGFSPVEAENTATRRDGGEDGLLHESTGSCAGGVHHHYMGSFGAFQEAPGGFSSEPFARGGSSSSGSLPQDHSHFSGSQQVQAANLNAAGGFRHAGSQQR